MREGVFRLLTFCFSAACLAAFVWFGLTVELGEHTLFGHMRAIGSTPEAKQLGEGIKTKVDDFVGIEAARRAAAEAARKAEGMSPRQAGRNRPARPRTITPPPTARACARWPAPPPSQAAGSAANAMKKSGAQDPRRSPHGRRARPRPPARAAAPPSPQPAAAVRRAAEAGPPK